jgi:hypothetical protein
VTWQGRMVVEIKAGKAEDTVAKDTVLGMGEVVV